MRIKSIEFYHVALKLVEPFETSRERIEYRHSILVRVKADDGVEGWGEIVADKDPYYSHEFLESELIVARDYIGAKLVGVDLDTPLDYWFLSTINTIRGHEMAKAGVEYALWDLYAKTLNKPLWRIIGGVRRCVPAGVSIGIQRSLDDLLRKVAYYIDQGYVRVKIKIKPGWDIEPVKAIRREYPDIPLSVDANGAYELHQARVLKALDDYNLLMIEQPLPPPDLEGHARLQRIIQTPICLDESIRSAKDVVRAYELDAARIINLKPGRVGGVKPSLDVEAVARAAGMGLWVGGMLETGVGRAFQVVIATLPGVNMPNDISASSRYYHEDIVEPPWEVKNGYICAPHSPGIGVEVAEKKLRKYIVRVTSVKA